MEKGQTVNKLFYTDKELADLLRVKPCTVSRLARRGPRGNSAAALDIRLAQPITVGNCRRWPVDRIHSLLGLAKQS